MTRQSRNRVHAPDSVHAPTFSGHWLLALLLLITIPQLSFASAKTCEHHFLTSAQSQNAPTRYRFHAKKMDAGQYYDDLLEYNTRYYNEAERKLFKISVRGGLLYDSRGEPLNIGNAIFVMDALTGDFFVLQSRLLSHDDRPRWQHSSPLAGGPVGAAGLLDVENGRLVHIDNGSGHYEPDLPFLRQALLRLREMGADLTETTVTNHRGAPLELADIPDFTPTNIERLEAHNTMVDLQTLKLVADVSQRRRVIRNGFESSNPQVVSSALTLAFENGLAEARTLKILAEHPNSAMRSALFSAIASSGKDAPRELLPIVLNGLHDHDIDVAASAAFALARAYGQSLDVIERSLLTARTVRIRATLAERIVQTSQDPVRSFQIYEAAVDQHLKNRLSEARVKNNDWNEVNFLSLAHRFSRKLSDHPDYTARLIDLIKRISPRLIEIRDHSEEESDARLNAARFFY